MLTQDPRVERVTRLMTIAAQALRQGQPSQAMMAVRQALALRPGEAKAHRLVGQIYSHMGKAALARQAYEAAASLEPAPAAGTAESAAETGEPAPAGAAPPLPVRREAAPLAEAFAVAEEPEVDEEPSPAQRRQVLEMAMQCLAQMASVEALIEQKGLGDSEAGQVMHETRSELGEQLKQVREAWRAEQLAQTGPPQSEVSGTHYEGFGAFTHTLGPGAMGEGKEVEDLQRLLNLEGLHLQVTGKFDTSTALAMRKFQERHHLTQRNGVVGSETRRLLNALVGRARSGGAQKARA